MVRMWNTWAIVAAVAAMTGTANRAVGQGGEPISAPPLPGSEAARLETKAAKFIQERRSWPQAAVLLRDAAAARGSGDPMAGEDLRAAGYLFFYAGDVEAALGAIRKTGWIFFGQGDLDRAASALLEGAWIAEQAGIVDQAAELAQWGALLQRPSTVQRVQYRPEA